MRNKDYTIGTKMNSLLEATHSITLEELEKADEKYIKYMDAGREAWEKAVQYYTQIEKMNNPEEIKLEEKKRAREEKIKYAEEAYICFDDAYWMAAVIPLRSLTEEKAIIWSSRKLAMIKSIPLALLLKEDYYEALYAVQQVLYAAEEILSNEVDRKEIRGEIDKIDKIILNMNSL